MKKIIPDISLPLVLLTHPEFNSVVVRENVLSVLTYIHCNGYWKPIPTVPSADACTRRRMVYLEERHQQGQVCSIISFTDIALAQGISEPTARTRSNLALKLGLVVEADPNTVPSNLGRVFIVATREGGHMTTPLQRWARQASTAAGRKALSLHILQAVADV